MYVENLVKIKYRVFNDVSKLSKTIERGIRSEKKSKIYTRTERLDYKLEKLLDDKLSLTNRDFLKSLNKAIKSIIKTANKNNVNVQFFFEETSAMKEHVNGNIKDFYCVGNCRLILYQDNHHILRDINFNRDVSVFKKMLFSNFSDLLVLIQNKKYVNDYKFDKTVDVIFSPMTGGYFVHEVVGHLLEGDMALQYFNPITSKNKIGDMIATSKLTVIDDPITDVNNLLPKYDDEGEMMKRTVLIKNGILNSFLCNKETAKLLNIQPNAHGHRTSYLFSAIPRMHNTYIKSNDNEINRDKLIQNTKICFVVDNISSGFVNALSGEFQLICEGFYKYENEKSNLMQVVIKDNVLRALSNIKDIGSDFKDSYSYCIKNGQPINVKVGSPSLKVKKMKVEWK